MSRYERKPSVDELCRTIITNGATDVREWMAAHPDDAAASDQIESLSRPFYKSGAEGCWIVEAEPDEYGCAQFESMVVRLPEDHNGRRQAWSALCEHLYSRVAFMESPELYDEDPHHYYGEEYCLLRLDPVEE